MTNSPTPPLLNVPEVALILHVSVRTVHRLIAEKKLPVVRIGRSVRVKPEAVARIIEGKQ